MVNRGSLIISFACASAFLEVGSGDKIHCYSCYDCPENFKHDDVKVVECDYGVCTSYLGEAKPNGKILREKECGVTGMKEGCEKVAGNLKGMFCYCQGDFCNNATHNSIKSGNRMQSGAGRWRLGLGNLAIGMLAWTIMYRICA